MTERKALGRGLSALIPEKARTGDKITNLKISQVNASKFQPREDFNPDKLNELISSIKEKGIIQPILVRSQEGGVYEVIAGERRLRAARALGLDEIPAIVKNVDDTELLEISIIENVQRENLNAIEQAHAYKKLMDEFSLSQEEIAKEVGKDRATIANTLRLLNLPDFVRNRIQAGEISFGHARALLSLNNPTRQIEYCKKIISENMSVRHIENLVAQVPQVRKKKKIAKDPHIVALEETLQRRLGTKVMIAAGRKRGVVKIEFYSNDDLDRILQIIGT